MIKHIVIFKMKASADGRTADENIEILVPMLKELKNRISVVKAMQAGRDVLHSARSYDVALVSEFESLERHSADFEV
jgi:hypothetical protein